MAHPPQNGICRRKIRRLALAFVRFRTKVARSYIAMDTAPPRTALRVVVVDDNYDANVGLTRLLERSGFEVAGRAYDGLAGLETIKTTNPDIAILDIAMPVLDGFGLATRIRQEMPKPPRLVALTGFAKELESDAITAGFDSYFCKPANWPKLKATLEGYSPR